jgi:hypothetical protein
MGQNGPGLNRVSEALTTAAESWQPEHSAIAAFTGGSVMRVAELGNRYDPARNDVPTRQQRAQAAPGAVAAARAAPRPETHPHRGEGRPGARRGQREGTGFEPFLIAAVLGLILWALILTPFFI